MKKKMREKLSVGFAKNPGKVIFLMLIFVNFLLIGISSLVISVSFPSIDPEEGFSFWRTLYRVLTMTLDAGCIETLVGKDPSKNAAEAVICIVIILISMVIFTGAVIGYLTNVISGIFESANSGVKRLRISNHTIIINWNSRASEIINDLLYSDHDEKVVVLVSENCEEIKLEIHNRIADTLEREKRDLGRVADELIQKGELAKWKRWFFIRKQRTRSKLTVIVRQGETYSLKQLNDICITQAKAVIILSKETDSIPAQVQENEKGNIHTVKTLIQVAQLTAGLESRKGQKIVVEVEDEWTLSLINKIIKQKKNDRCSIVPIPVNRVLGEILSQFSIMPELNSVYSELFSNNGLTFYSERIDTEDKQEYISTFLHAHSRALPITVMDIEGKKELFYIAKKAQDIEHLERKSDRLLDLELGIFSFERKHIAILGHNSKCLDVMKGFEAFANEWDGDHQLIDMLIIDDREHLEKVDNYREFEKCFSIRTVKADVYDKEVITAALTEYIDSYFEDTSILILSDDSVVDEELDASSLTYLIYVQDIISEKMRQSESGDISFFRPDNIDVIVELNNPKNYDVACSYSANNVIISNRYVSRMIVQLGDKEEIYHFYKDILTYDTHSDSGVFKSKELYIKIAERFFGKHTVFPIKASAGELIRTIYEISPPENKSVLIGISHQGENTLLLNDDSQMLEINADDKLILFSPH